MFSKILTLTLLTTLLGACGWIKDQPKGAQNFQSKNLDLSCLKVAPLQVQRLFNGELTKSPEDVAQEREIWACLDHGLNTFSSYTHGANPAYYTSEELQTFANRYLPPDQPFTTRFISAIFRLKTAVIGGDDTKITRTEIERLRGKLKSFGVVIEPLAPYIGALLVRNAPDSPIKAEAGAVLNQFVLGLALVLSDSSNAVAWDDLKNFIIQLELYTNKGKPSALTLVREQIDIFKSIKLLIVGGDEDSIEREKWTPILQSISHVYNAIFVTSGTTSALERLSIEVQSTDEERQLAVNHLKSVFIRLKEDETLTSHIAITKMSDTFAKILLINNFLFPKYRGTLALKAFLENAILRKLAGTIVAELPKPGTTLPEPELQKLADDVITFLDQAFISSSTQNVPLSTVSLTALQQDLDGMKRLLAKPLERDLIYNSLNALKQGIPVLIGKDAEHLTSKDFAQVIQKALDLYFTWAPARAKNVNEQIGASLDILLRAPSVNTVSENQLLEAISETKKVMIELQPANTIPWDLLQSYVKKSLTLKAVLFQNSDNFISSYELSQLAYLWDPFRRNEDLSVAISAVANLLANRPFAEARFADLFPAIDAFLPEGQRLSQRGVSAKVLGDLKFLLAGGSRDSIKPSEYSTLAKSLSVLYSKLAPKIKNLPKDFAPGLNSTTMDLASAFVEGFMLAREKDIDLTDLKALILDMTQQAGFNVRPQTVDALLIGVTTRVFSQSKLDKPFSIRGMVLKPGDLKVALPLLHTLQEELADVESAYHGLDIKSVRLSRSVLLGRLKQAGAQEVIQSIQPLLDGDTHLHHFPKKHVINDHFYEYDVAYKTGMFSILKWLMPFYQIENPDDSKIRLALNDLTDLLTDINDLVFDLKLSFGDSPPAKTAVTRMQNMNLFTRVGNGDEYMDPLEGTEFLTITSGGKVLLGKIENALFPKCFPGITDYDTVKSVPYACLTKVFFSKAYMEEVYTPVLPQLVDQYLKWSPEEIEVYRKAAFTATRPEWTENGSMPMADFESLISLPYFLENVFERFDADEDDILRFSELMNAFPIFCQEINTAAGGKLKGSCHAGENPGQIEAVYGYLIFNGHAPTGTEPGNSIGRRIRATAQMLVWFKRWNHLDRSPEVRDQLPPFIGRQDLLSIISNLAQSNAEAEASPELDPVLPE